MNNEINAKIILLGDSGVGKTTISNWALTGSFNDQFSPTVGGNYVSKTIQINESTIKLQIWDTAGDEKYRSLIPMFFRDARGAVLVYSIKDRQSFKILDYFVNSLQDKAPTVFKIVVGNKSDMESERQISSDEGQQYANEIHAQFLETSAKLGSCIDSLLQLIAQQVYDTQTEKASQDQTNNQIKLNEKSGFSCPC
ncbi:Ras- protein Rab-22A [Tritrichomonas musculus]|uniref:Ras- protein Rab-22A n=1 Tax=Tritrichomonas musculus TaxID=1915356 RepID=A0ABR2KUB6_9EUKA